MNKKDAEEVMKYYIRIYSENAEMETIIKRSSSAYVSKYGIELPVAYNLAIETLDVLVSNGTAIMIPYSEMTLAQKSGIYNFIGVYYRLAE